MVCKEEVFEWFAKELSGPKRVELMCGLMSMCIPLEIRFFKSYIEELAKKDMNALREAEVKANSFAEMDTICKCDLLHIAADIAINDTNELNKNVANCETVQTNTSLNNSVNQSLQQQIPQQIPQPLHQTPQTPIPVMPIQDMTGVAANGTAVLTQNDIITVVPTPSPPGLSQYPSRSRLIISLCFLSPANRNCSGVAFKALRQQLTAHQIGTVVNNYLKYGRNVYDLDDFFSGIRLLLTLALYHPAFSYDQRELIARQREEVERTIDTFLNPHYRQNPNFTANTVPYQTYGGHQGVHTPPTSQIHGHIGPHPTQAHPQSPGVNAGGQTTHSHSHSHVNVGQMPVSGPVPTHATGQYATHPYIPQMSVTNISYNNQPPNMSNLRVSNITSPVSTPSPTSSPSSSKTVTSVAAISPLPMSAEFMNLHSLEGVSNQSPYILTTSIPLQPHQKLSEDGGCAKNIISCYNCGSIGHRGDDCRTQSQEEANR